MFHAEFTLLVDRWSRWALDVVRGWPSDTKAATPDRKSLAAIQRKMERRQRERKSSEESA